MLWVDLDAKREIPLGVWRIQHSNPLCSEFEVRFEVSALLTLARGGSGHFQVLHTMLMDAMDRWDGTNR